MRISTDAVGGGAFGLALSIAGFHFFQWQFWLLFVVALVWRNLPERSFA